MKNIIGFHKNTNGLSLIDLTKYRVSHTSYTRGYHTVKGDTIETYNGKFGKGFKVHSNASNTTNYHLVTYVIER